MNVIGKSKAQLFKLANETGHGDKAKDTPAANVIDFPERLMPLFYEAAYKAGFSPYIGQSGACVVDYT